MTEPFCQSPEVGHARVPEGSDAVQAEASPFVEAGLEALRQRESLAEACQHLLCSEKVPRSVRLGVGKLSHWVEVLCLDVLGGA